MTIKDAKELLIIKDGNPACPACQERRQHTVKDWAMYHPLKGTGVDIRDMRTATGRKTQ